MADLPNVHHEQIDEFKRIAGSANILKIQIRHRMI